MIQESFQAARQRLQSGPASGEEHTVSAIDVMVQTEQKFAAKENRKPEYHICQTYYNELSI